MKCAPAEIKKCNPGFIFVESVAVSTGAALSVVSLTVVSLIAVSARVALKAVSIGVMAESLFYFC